MDIGLLVGVVFLVAGVLIILLIILTNPRRP